MRTVVFDLGGVLLDWNPRYLYRELFDDEQEMERFLAEVCTLDWHVANDLGGRPVRENCAELARRHPEHAEAIIAWGERSEDMVGGVIEGTVQILAELRDRGVPLYALTNMEAETFPQRRERFAFMRWFDGAVVSAWEGIVKPDPEIFRRLLSRFALDPATTVFIDDAQRNVDAAAELGLQAVRFEGPAALREWLVARGVL
ncbi:MAG TPA: HAD family phosphatase [Solirubrobacteraceae bacterium]|nr:HAD family phosphatase [Solirubrobacteraceae bacterium]